MIRFLAATLAFFIAVPYPGQAQPYPNKPIRVIVGSPPGGSVDRTARLIADGLASALGQPVVIENRGGASGRVADEFVSQAAPDGYTLLYSIGSNTILQKYLSKTKPIDLLEDLTPIATAALSVNIIAVGKSHPASSLAQFLDLARRNPGKIATSTSGTGSYYHLIAELLKHQHGIDLLQVPYRGTGPQVTALLGGEVQASLINYASVFAQVKEANVKALGVMERERFPETPDIPTFAEVLPGFKAPPSWFGFFGPAKLPDALVVALNNAITKVLQTPDVSAKIRGLYLNVLITPLDQLRPFIIETDQMVGTIVKTAGIQPVD